MSNIFNDLNKLVNTVQKVDKLLTEKPKRPRTLYITKRFTESELRYLYFTLKDWGSECVFHGDEEAIHKNLLNKLK